MCASGQLEGPKNACSAGAVYKIVTSSHYSSINVHNPSCMPALCIPSAAGLPVLHAFLFACASSCCPRSCSHTYSLSCNLHPTVPRHACTCFLAQHVSDEVASAGATAREQWVVCSLPAPDVPEGFKLMASEHLPISTYHFYEQFLSVDTTCLQDHHRSTGQYNFRSSRCVEVHAAA